MKTRVIARPLMFDNHTAMNGVATQTRLRKSEIA